MDLQNPSDNFFGLRKAYFGFLILVVVVLAVSMNIAWINPRPEYEVVKNPKIPLGWQYDLDSGMNLLTATYFPEYFVYNAQRISRPFSYMMAHLLGASIQLAAKPFAVVSPLVATAAGFIALKIFVYLSAAILFYHLLLFYMPPLAAFLAAGFLLTQHYSITYITTFGETDAQWMNPIFIGFLFHHLCRNYSHGKNIIFSMVLGVLMLTKQNYAMYIAIVFWSLWQKRYKECALSLAAYCVPYLLWRGYVAQQGILYFNPQITMEHYGMGYFKEVLATGPFSAAQIVLVSFKDFLTSCLHLYNIPLILLLISFNKFRARFGNKLFVFFGLFVFSTWIQFFATRKVLNTVMVGDFSLFIWGLGALAIYELFSNYEPKKQSRIAYSILFVWFTFSLLSLANFPWIAPKDQKEHVMPKSYLAPDAPVPTYQWFPDRFEQAGATNPTAPQVKE